MDAPTPSDAVVAASTPTVVVHHLEDSRSQRVLWLLEELNVPYEVKKYKRTPQRLAPKELLDVHPLGKSPVITDGAVTLAESGAIVEYLIKKYGAGKVDVSESGWIDDLYFTHYSEGSVQPLLVRRLVFRLLPQRVPALIRPIVKNVLTKADSLMNGPDLRKHGDLIEKHLEKNKVWFAGGDNPTASDYMMGFTLEILVNRAPEVAGPKTIEYVRRMQARPAYKRALEKGGEYAYILP
ncbi:Glutathione S-transferase 3 [Psilocybe cubensis]|uniref:Glutathione S-transferase 3 n=2 Tax=Psilocybe cubensis TaxID=181762 RepID=A0ACB8HE64_PSICU|nr:Glutathione S-transferase 3 [Psilocybe cubensis]KAH9485984.1 Glutathione S-transferase 3 [Psilocybe cubensis]